MNIKLIYRLLFAFLAGAPTTLAFAPFGYWPVALITPVFLLLLLHKQSAFAGVLIAFFWGVGHFTTGTTWVFETFNIHGGLSIWGSILATAALVAYLSLYPAIFGGLLNGFFPNSGRRRLLIAAPIFWLINEWLRGWAFTGIPWIWLGYSQIDSPLAGFAPLSGVSAISFMMMLFAGATAYAILHRQKEYTLLAITVLMIGYILININWVKNDPTTKTTFALVQGNTTPDLKFDYTQRSTILETHRRLSEPYYLDADIILWAESSIPDYIQNQKDFIKKIDTEARNTNTAMIVGAFHRESDNDPTMNIILNLGENNTPSYDFSTIPYYQKHHLLPFGEFVPLKIIFGDSSPFFRISNRSLMAGDLIQENLIAKGRHLLATICFEILFGEQMRLNMTDKTDFLISLSNDSWFGNTIGPIQNLEMARMRALELGKPLLRSANDGLTVAIDHKGKIIDQIPRFEQNVLKVSVNSTMGQTPYFKLGSSLLYEWCILGLILAWISGRIRRKKLNQNDTFNLNN